MTFDRDKPNEQRTQVDPTGPVGPIAPVGDDSWRKPGDGGWPEPGEDGVAQVDRLFKPVTRSAEPRPHEPDHIWRPSVRERPTGLNELLMGERRVLHYTLDKPPPQRTKIGWEHEILRPNGARLRATTDGGSTTELAIDGNEQGVTHVKMFVTTVHEDESSRQLVSTQEIATPKPTSMVERMLSEPTPGKFAPDERQLRGRIPVIDEMQLGEDLLVRIKSSRVGNQVELHLGAWTTAQFDLVAVDRETNEIAIVRLRPRALGVARGGLWLSLDGSSGVVAGFAGVNVRPMPSIHDFGADPNNKVHPHGRPLSPDDALEHYMAVIGTTFKERGDAVIRILERVRHQDPPNSEISAAAILATAGKIALGAVTAGLGAAIVEHFEQRGGGEKELIKAFVEQSLNSTVQITVDAFISRRDAKRPLTEQYLKVQTDTLSAQQEHVIRVDRTEQKSRVRLMEHRDPGTGFEMMMRLTQAAERARAVNVEQQEIASSDGYATLIAEQGLGMMHAAIGGASDPSSKQLIDEGTLNYNVDLRSPHGLPRGVPQASAIDSLLRLELVADPSATKSHHLKIEAAAIHGMNDAQRTALEGRQISDIKAPVVAHFVGQYHALNRKHLAVMRDWSWTIGKDGEGNMSALSNEERSLERQTNTQTPIEGASAVFSTLGKCPKPHDA